MPIGILICRSVKPAHKVSSSCREGDFGVTELVQGFKDFFIIMKKIRLESNVTMEVYIDFPMELIHKRKLKLALAVVSTVACVNVGLPVLTL